MKIVPQTSYVTIPGIQPGAPIPKDTIDDKRCAIIIALVEAEFGIPFDRMASIHRRREFVEARHTAVYLLRMHTRKSTSFLGQMFGGRDHTTILYAVKAVRDLMRTVPEFKQRILKLENQLAV